MHLHQELKYRVCNQVYLKPEKPGYLANFEPKSKPKSRNQATGYFGFFKNPLFCKFCPRFHAKTAKLDCYRFSVTTEFLPVIPLPVMVKHFYRYYRYRLHPYAEYRIFFNNWNLYCATALKIPFISGLVH